MSEQVIVREVGLRDGLQLIRKAVPTEIKLEWCREQAAAGFAEIEVSSFVPPALLPQFADAKAVLACALEIEGLRASVLVPNLKGAVRAMEAGARKINFVLSASEAHNRANVRRSTDDSLAMFRELLDERRARGLEEGVEICGAIATAFGCTIQGEVAASRVCRIAETMAASGADEVNVADTVGYANPAQVERLFGGAASAVGSTPLAGHFHDTRAMGLANVTAAVRAGVRRFDAALGGLGGCPFAPGATGNIATEDCVYLLESMGFDTGVNLPALLRLRAKLEEWLPGEHIEGRLSKAGLAKTFTRRDTPVAAAAFD